MKSPLCKTLVALTAHAFLMMNSPLIVLASSETDNQYLDMGLAQLMQMTITSVSKKPQTLADTAAAVFVITQEDIRRSGVTSIPEALAMAPGMQVARISSSKWSISARGFGGYTSNKLLVMIDGRSVYSPGFSGTFWDMQNTLLEDIDRIEVIRGPGGTIWGANAVNGVINIITKKSQDTLGTMVQAGAGNQEKLMAGARYGATLGESAFGRLYVTANDRDSNELSGSDQDAHDGWRTIQGGFRMDGMIGSNNEWTLHGDLYKNKEDQIIFPFWLDSYPYLKYDYSNLSADGGNLTGSWQHRFTGGDLLTCNGYYDYNNRKDSYFDQSFATLDLNLQYEIALGERNSLTMGAGYRNIDGNFSDTFQVHIPDQTDELYSAFLQDEIKLISDRLWLTLGAKYEHNDFTDSEWQPSARLLWKPAENHSLWTAVARAVRTPSVVENNGMIRVGFSSYPPSPNDWLLLRGAPDFDSEILTAYEAGYRWQARPDLSLDVAVYYNDYDDISSALPITDPTSLYFTNAKQGDGHGVEVAVNWQTSSWLSFFFTYTWQELKLEIQNPAMAFYDDISYSWNYPEHMASVRSAVDFAENWQLNCWLRYVADITGRNSANYQRQVPTPSYYLLDANLVWKPRKDLEIMLAGQNLFNSSQRQYVAEMITPSTEIERSIYGKITWRF